MNLSLRALVDDDRWRLLRWRNSDRVRVVSRDDSVITDEVHSRWFDRALAERSDELRVTCWQDRPVGLVQIEGLDHDQGTSSWGCYLGDTDVPPGVGAVLPLLGLGHGFGALGLRRMTAQVLAINTNMISVHRRLRIPVEGTMRRHVRRADGAEVDAYLYGVHRDEWPGLRDAATRLLPSHVRAEVASLTATSD